MVLRRSKKGRFESLHHSTKSSIVRSLKENVGKKFKSASEIAKDHKVSKAVVISINSEMGVRRISKEEATRIRISSDSRLRNKKRYNAALDYVKSDGIKKGNDPRGVSVNGLMDYLKGRKISPGEKKNLGELLNFAIKEVEKLTRLPVVRRTRSSQSRKR